MPNYKSFKELKTLAQYQMEGKFSVLIGAMLLQELILLIASFFGTSLFPGTDTISTIFYFIVTFLIQLLSGVLQVGACLIFLRTACRMPCRITDLFYGFKNNPDKAIKIQVVFALLSTICLLPSDLAYLSTPVPTDYETIYRILLITLLGHIVNLLITLPISPMFFLMLDFPNLTVKELFMKSFEIMKGNCIRYLLLQLSFFPLYFLSFFTCGLSLLLFIPYMNVTCTNFYLDIMACRNRQMQ